jgi:signal recognition particle receptor subunit beta
MQECYEAFAECCQTDRVKGKPILIYANKQDLPGALSEVLFFFFF